MRHSMAVVSMIALLTAASATASAGNPSKEERIGVGTGGVIGAIAGGPAGFIVGAAFGAKIGEKMNRKNAEIDTLSGSLQDSYSNVVELQGDISSLHSDVDTLGAELTRIQTVARPELVSLLQAGIAMDLLFRTDEHVLADTTGGRLAELAGTLASMPDIRVQLDGFADERGNEDYNFELSERRVEFVREQMIAAGIDASRISVTAHGEAPAQDATVDSYALERRVSLTVFIDDSPSFASNPNNQL